MADPAAATSAGRRVVVLAGGDPVPMQVVEGLAPPATVIAADAGLHLADALGLTVDLVVGDMDSVDPQRLAAARAAGIAVDEHPADKDRTDLAIALDTALEQAPAEVTVIGGSGGRLDHLLANALLLAAERYARLRLTLRSSAGIVTVIRDEAHLVGQPGDLVSLLPTHGTATGVRTSGLVFPLHGEPLEAGSSRGVSNRFATTTATVQLTDGVLLAVQPAPPAGHGEHGAHVDQ